ncbi:fasciclin domain-containing protein [Flavobacterium sp. XGLA_31]|uniref:fasciclin domain-containing protein n=1 Tax=Flavobacterium sp. XGLA_31 TaxID=3447666 RepID=UPI003F33D1A6
MKNLMKKLGGIAIAISVISCSQDNGNKSVGAQSIATIAKATPEMDSLVVALDLTNLTSTFETQGDYTVFAPTNDAFSSFLSGLGEPSLAQLEEDYPGYLANILKYHVLTTRVLSTSLTNNQEITTLQGQNFKVMIEDNTDPSTYYFYNNILTLTNPDSSSSYFAATVLARDVNCSNGTLNPIDSVMLPVTE